MLSERIGPLFGGLGLHQMLEGSHDAAKEMVATWKAAQKKNEAFSIFKILLFIYPFKHYPLFSIPMSAPAQALLPVV